MELSDIFFAILYGGAFVLIIYFIIDLVKPSKPATVVVYDETPVVDETYWWPWAGGPYNYWPYWTGWWSGGGDGGYGGWYGRRYGGGGRHWTGGRPWGGGGRGGFGGGGRGGGGRGGGGGGRH
jgi:hypothetical protein